MKSLSMLSRKLYLRLKRIAEADFQQFFKNTEDTLLMFDDQDYERHEERKLGLPFDFFFKYWKWGGTIKKSCISINFNLFPVDLYYTIAFTAQGNQSFNREIKINGEQVYFQMTLKKWMTDNIIIGSRSYWPNYLLFCRLDWCDSCWWRYLLRSSWCFCC